MGSTSEFKAGGLAWLIGLVVVVVMFGITRAGPVQAVEDPPSSTAAPQHGAEPQPGTVITQSNWKQYGDYLGLEIYALFSGEYATTMTPGFEMHVGPTIHFQLPSQYREDTEKYSSQVRLQHLPTGGTKPVGWVAGEPFPNPTEPDLAAKMEYDNYYEYKPAVLHRHAVGPYIDRYGEIRSSESVGIFFRVTHISDIGWPRTYPGGDPRFFATNWQETMRPEQSKYATSLTLFPDDPAEDEEIFSFVPSLRRIVRGSSAARCTPVGGSDAFYDDLNGGFNGLPSNYSYKYLATKKVLIMRHMNDPVWHEMSSWVGVPFLPRPSVGNYELAPVWVLEIHALDSVLPGYCYSKRVVNIDLDSLSNVQMGVWDNQGHLWKSSDQRFTPEAIPGGKPGDVVSFSNGNVVGGTLDLQNVHMSVNMSWNAEFLNDVETEFRDPRRYGSIAGLAKVMQ